MSQILGEDTPERIAFMKKRGVEIDPNKRKTKKQKRAYAYERARYELMKNEQWLTGLPDMSNRERGEGLIILTSVSCVIAMFIWLVTNYEEGE